MAACRTCAGVANCTLTSRCLSFGYELRRGLRSQSSPFTFTLPLPFFSSLFISYIAARGQNHTNRFETVTREKTSPAKTNVFPRRHSFVLFFSSLHIGIAAAEPERIQIARNCYTREIEPRRNRCLSRPRVRFPFLGPNASLFAAPFCLLLTSNGYIARRGQKDTNRSKLLHARRNASAETDVLPAVPPISPFTLPSCSSPDFQYVYRSPRPKRPKPRETVTRGEENEPRRNRCLSPTTQYATGLETLEGNR